MPHFIRLRGLWQYSIVESGSQSVGSFRVPGTFSDFCQTSGPFRVELTRVFHRPTGLDADSHVSLVGQGSFGDSYSVELNNFELPQGGDKSFQVDVTHLLQDANRILIRAESNGTPVMGNDLRIEDVRLEIS